MNTFSFAGFGIKSVAALVAVFGILTTVGGPLLLAEHYASTADRAAAQVQLAQSASTPAIAQSTDLSALNSGTDLNRHFEPTAAGALANAVR